MCSADRQRQGLPRQGFYTFTYPAYTFAEAGVLSMKTKLCLNSSKRCCADLNHELGSNVASGRLKALLLVLFAR